MVEYDDFEYLECLSLVKGLVEISEKCDITLLKKTHPTLVTLCHKIPNTPVPPLRCVISPLYAFFTNDRVSIFLILMHIWSCHVNKNKHTIACVNSTLLIITYRHSQCFFLFQRPKVNHALTKEKRICQTKLFRNHVINLGVLLATYTKIYIFDLNDVPWRMRFSFVKRRAVFSISTHRRFFFTKDKEGLFLPIFG